jgi:glycosyltransferase involved in cell wall biosynthesis
VTRDILVSGWRSIHHSYAVVNQFLCLELLRRAPAVRLYFHDVPYYDPSWQAKTGLFSAEAEQALRSIPPPPADLEADAEFRIAFPYDLLRPSRSVRTAVFGTAEFLHVSPDCIAGSLAQAQRNSGFPLLTPSTWSKRGLVRSGVDGDSVFVVPHGFDPEIFRPATPAQREQFRREMGFAADDCVFLSVGAMTASKGLQFLLPAFARLLEIRPQSRLVLKGVDGLYLSSRYLEDQIGHLDPGVAAAIRSRLSYLGEDLSFEKMARLYQASDCYVSPYVAEGFNMPVMEAAACGLPVICTAGGSTDDFVTEDFALQISSTLEPWPVHNIPNAVGLVPDLEHLVHLMLCVTDDLEFRESARIAAPKHLGERFTWAKIVDRLLPILIDGRPAR